MRGRVSTKSPVRENCTPGSVRGLSGNWQSYRDPEGVANFIFRISFDIFQLSFLKPTVEATEQSFVSFEK